jgi:hypothetical protein
MEKTLTPTTFRLCPATTGISLDRAPALRQNFTNRSIRAVSYLSNQPTQPNENSIARFFRDLTNKQEICVTKQRSPN